MLPVVLLPPATLQLKRDGCDLTREEFFEFCEVNDDWKIERNATGEIEMTPPTGGTTGHRNLKLSQWFGNWEDDHPDIGKLFDSSTNFELPNGATRGPDVAWVSQGRLDALTDEEKDGFPPLCPDFVLELRSRSDSLTKLQEKMAEYLENGAKLGWLIDPKGEQAFVYRAVGEVETVGKNGTLSGEDVLPGFELELARIWKLKL